MKRTTLIAMRRRRARPRPALVLRAVLADVEGSQRHARRGRERPEPEPGAQEHDPAAEGAEPQRPAAGGDAAQAPGRDPGEPRSRRVHPAGERHRVGGRDRLALDRADPADGHGRRRPREHDRDLDPGRRWVLPGAGLPEPARRPGAARARRLDQRVRRRDRHGRVGEHGDRRQHREQQRWCARPERDAHRAHVHRRTGSSGGRLHDHPVGAEQLDGGTTATTTPGGSTSSSTPPASTSGTSS